MVAISRQTADLSEFPDLIVIYLGMRAHSFRGLVSLVKIGPQIQRAVDAKPDGLLRHEQVFFSLIPPHAGMRQYWRDFESLEKWTRAMPHMAWWKDLLSRPQGVSFWHETYAIRGGIESVFLNAKDTGARPGLLGFAPAVDATASMFSARRRLRREGAELPPVVAE